MHSMDVVDQTSGFESSFCEELDLATQGVALGVLNSLDFYEEADDTSRGAILDNACFSSPLQRRTDAQGLNPFEESVHEHSSIHGAQGEIYFATALTFFEQHLLASDSKPHTQSLALLQMSDFQQAAQPPELGFGGLVGPTVVLKSALAADVMESMYSQFQKQPGSVVTKVRLHKCSMTMTAFVQEGDLLLQCCVKIRLFKLGAWDDHDNQKRTVVEFQRREGDGIAFARIFNRVVSALREVFVVEDNAMFTSNPTLPTPSLPITAAERATIDLQPYIDTLEKVASPAEQADVLAATVVLAQKTPKLATTVAAAVAHLQGFLQALQASTMNGVAYPALLLATRLHENTHSLGID